LSEKASVVPRRGGGGGGGGGGRAKRNLCKLGKRRRFTRNSERIAVGRPGESLVLRRGKAAAPPWTIGDHERKGRASDKRAIKEEPQNDLAFGEGVGKRQEKQDVLGDGIGGRRERTTRLPERVDLGEKIRWER